MENFSISDLLALYGALLSSVLLGWNIFRDITDRGKLKVHCYIGHLIMSAVQNDDVLRLVYNVTNIGRKPVVVTQVGGECKKAKKEFLITPQNIPKRLEPGEYLIEYTQNLNGITPDITNLCAWDSFGKVYRVKKSLTRKLIKDAVAKK